MNAITAGTSFPTFFIQISPIDASGRRRKPFLQRFIENVRIGAAHECWESELTPRKGSMGYSQIWRDGACHYMHRVAYEISHGPIPPGMQVLHKCDNPRCCNPNHLKLGTANDNMVDKAEKKRSRANLTRKQVLKIDQMLKDGVSDEKISKRFNVTAKSVRLIAWGVTWAKVTGRETPKDRVEAKRKLKLDTIHRAEEARAA